MNCTPPLRYTLLPFLLFIIACSEPEKPVTKEEAAKMAAMVTDVLAQRNASRFNELLDLDAFEKRMLNHANNNLNRSSVVGAMESLGSGELGLQIVRSLGDKGAYELVKQYEKDNHQRLIFRLYDELDLNYHDFELIKKGDQVKIADVFAYNTGENLTSIMAESLLDVDEQQYAGKKEAKKMQLIKKYITAKEYEKADEVFESLPAVLKEQKQFRMIYLTIAAGLGDEKHLAALNKYQENYPDAPNMYLLTLGIYLLKEDFPAALRSVNRLDSFINKDPYLDFHRALIYREIKDTVNRLASLERLHQNMPGFGTGTVELIVAYLDGKQLDKAVSLTQQYRKGKDADAETLETLYLLYPELKEKIETTSDQ